MSNEQSWSVRRYRPTFLDARLEQAAAEMERTWDSVDQALRHAWQGAILRAGFEEALVKEAKRLRDELGLPDPVVRA